MKTIRSMLFSGILKMWFVPIVVLTSSEISAQGAWTIEQTFTIPGKASGLAWDGTYLYYGIYGSGGSNFYRFDPATAQATQLFSISSVSNSYGMTYDGSSLWIIDRGSTGNSYALNVSLTGTVLGQFSLPQQYMSGIAWDDGNFWAASYYPDPGWIYKVNAQGNILQQFAPPQTQTWDLARQGDNLWVVDYNANMIYKTDLSGLVLESYPSITARPSGIVHTGTHVWYVAGPLSANSTLYKVNPGGTGTPQISINPTIIDFGNVQVNQSHNQSFTVSNAGSGTLSFSFQQPPQASQVSLPSGSFTLGPGQSLNATANWLPTQTGPMSTSGAVTSNDPINPIVTLNFSGNAFTPTPLIVANPESVQFGNIRKGASKFTRITLTNQGQATLTISNIATTDANFYVNLPFNLPLSLAPSGSAFFDAWYYPQQPGSHSGAISIISNSPTQNPFLIPVNGQATETSLPLGSIVWDVALPPATDNSPKAIHWIPDITGDSRPEIVVASEDNYIRCFNGNGSGTGQVIWERNIYSGSLYQQQAITLGGDINNDGLPDLVVGTAWGDRSVVAINSRTGEIIWKYQTNQYGLGGWVYQVDATYDYNGDGFPDVLASSGNDQNGTGPKRVFCLNGKNGQMIWNYAFTGPVISVMGITDVTGDGQPDVFAGGSNNGESQGRVALINGATGFLAWDFITAGTSVWGIAQMDDLNNDGKPELAAGTFNGVIYIFNAVNGNIMAQTSVGNNIITRLVRMEDVNGDGKADLALGYSGSLAMVLNGTNLQQIWTFACPDKPWNVACIPDVNGDGINDLVVGLLYQNNQIYVFNGTDGNILFTSPYPQAVDAVGTIPDLTFDGSWEFVAGGRQGKVMVYSGGPDAVTGIGQIDTSKPFITAAPNPFKHYTLISLALKENEQVTAQIYDLAGKQLLAKKITGLANGPIQFVWDGTSDNGARLKPGVYILEVTANGQRRTLKLLLSE